MKRPIDGLRTATLFCGLALPFVVQDDNCAARVIRTADPPMRATQTIQTISTDAGKKPCFDEEDGETSGAREAAAVAKLSEHYRYWLAEDAVYIITPEERCAYLQLSSDDEREQFINQFWIRRARDPESLLNDFEEEHYRRIVYANENFVMQTAGWMTDRGHIYIEYGPPDKIELHASGEPTGFEYPCEVWRYRYLEGIGQNVEMQFVDTTGLGGYRLTVRPADKDQIVFVPRGLGSGFATAEEQAESQPSIEIYVRPSPQGIPQYKDLEAMAVSRIVRGELSFRHESEYKKATHATTMARLVVIIPSDELQSAGTDGESITSEFQVFGRLTKPSGWVVSTFEFPTTGEALRTVAAYTSREVTLPLEPGVYQLALVVKDVGSGLTGTEYTSVEVPTFEELTVNQ